MLNQLRATNASYEEIFLFLVENLIIPNVQARQRINLNSLSDSDLLHLTRFTSQVIREVSNALRLSESFTTPSRYRFTREEGFSILYTRLAWPSRLQTLSLLLGYSASMISEAFFWVLAEIQSNWDFLLCDFNSGHLTTDRLSLFAAAIYKKGAPLPNC